MHTTNYIHCVSKKNIPDVVTYNSDFHNISQKYYWESHESKDVICSTSPN